jgi:hypothetical protein
LLVRKPLFALIALALVATGCRVNAKASANLNTGKKQDDSFDEEPPPAGSAQSEQLPSEYALLGARHDLRLAPDKKTPTCSCLAVALGGPADASFVWDGPAPAIDPETQLVVALSSEGIACPGAKEELGVSYWGYRQSGDDVIVIVENLRGGRPVTSGAVIPKPLGNGQVYVRPAHKKVPYGKPLNTADKLCKIGNPGPVRSGTTPKQQQEEEQDW